MKVDRTLGNAVGAIFLCFGLLFLAVALGELPEAWQSRTWPSTPGTITSSETVRMPRRRGKQRTRPSIEYRYTVAGVERTGKRMFFGDTDRISWQSGAEDFVAAHPVGRTVEVHYDPEKPDQAVVEPGLTLATALGPLVCALFAVIGVLVLVLSRREIRGAGKPWTRRAAA